MSYLSRVAGRLLGRAPQQRSFSASAALCVDTPTHTGQTFAEDDPRSAAVYLSLMYGNSCWHVYWPGY